MTHHLLAVPDSPPDLFRSRVNRRRRAPEPTRLHGGVVYPTRGRQIVSCGLWRRDHTPTPSGHPLASAYSLHSLTTRRASACALTRVVASGRVEVKAEARLPSPTLSGGSPQEPEAAADPAAPPVPPSPATRSSGKPPLPADWGGRLGWGCRPGGSPCGNAYCC